MPAETRIQIASSLRQGSKDLAERWAREFNSLYSDSSSTLDELTQKSKVGIEILANLLEGADIASYGNFIRKLALEWINSGGTIEELKNLKDRFLLLCKNRFSFIEIPGYTEDQLIEELNTFFEKELWQSAAVEYLAVYESEIGVKLRKLPDANESLKKLLILTAKLGGIVEGWDTWEELLLEMRDIFPSMDAGAVFAYYGGKLTLKALAGFEDFVIVKNSNEMDFGLYEDLARRHGITITSSANIDKIDRLIFHRRHLATEGIRREYPRRLLTFPLVANNSLIGLAVLYSFSDGEFFVGEELDLLEVLITNLKSALASSGKISDLQERRHDSEALLELHKRISGLGETELIGSAFLTGIAAHLGDIRSVVYLIDESHNELVPIAWFDTLEEPGKPQLSSLYTFSLERKAPIFLASLKDNPVLKGITPPSELIKADEDGALGIIPLIAGNETIGIWGISTPGQQNLVEGRRFFLTLAGTNLAYSLKDVLAFTKIRREHESRGREIRLAASLQQYLVPRYYRGHGYEVEIMLEAGGDLAGDFAFLDEPSKDGFIAVIGDVSGRGIAAGMSMMSTYGLLGELVKTSNPPGLILERLNNRLREQYDKSPAPFHDEAFVTCFLISADKDGSIRYAKAGHLPPILFRHKTNQSELLEIRGVPLGIFADSIYEEHEIGMEPGDVLLLFTDGITEARDVNGEEFGNEKLLELVKRWHTYPPGIIKKMIGYSLSRFIEPGSKGDDRTWIVISRDIGNWTVFKLPTIDKGRREALKSTSDFISKTPAAKFSTPISHVINEAAGLAQERGLKEVDLRILTDKDRFHLVLCDTDPALKGLEYPRIGGGEEIVFPSNRKALAMIKMDMDFIWHNENSRELNIYKSFSEGAVE